MLKAVPAARPAASGSSLSRELLTARTVAMGRPRASSCRGAAVETMISQIPNASVPRAPKVNGVRTMKTVIWIAFRVQLESLRSTARGRRVRCARGR